MNPKPISVQLYSLREAAAENFQNVLERVAKMGYAGVEPAGFYGMTPSEFKARIDDLGLKISSTHSPWCNPDNLNEVIETAGILDVKYIVCGYGPDAFKSVDAIKQTAEEVNAMVEALEKHGLCLIQHNHAWEFDRLGDELMYEVYAQHCPRVQFELDLYWAANYGAVDVPSFLRRHAKRTPFLHVKDGPLKRDMPMLALGQGNMDIPACVQAADPDVLKWLVVELDHYDGDMFEAVEKSCHYLIEQGLGYGNQR